jgi:hypothetical protein
VKSIETPKNSYNIQKRCVFIAISITALLYGQPEPNMNGLSDIFYLSKSTAAKGNEPLASVEGESTSDLFFMYGIPYCIGYQR